MITFPAKKKAHCPVCGGTAKIVERSNVSDQIDKVSFVSETVDLDCNVCGRFHMWKVPRV